MLASPAAGSATIAVNAAAVLSPSGETPTPPPALLLRKGLSAASHDAEPPSKRHRSIRRRSTVNQPLDHSHASQPTPATAWDTAE